MNINLTPLIEAVIGVVAALITFRLIPWIKARTTVAQQEQLKAAVRIAIFAAEQVYGAGKGSEKFDYALGWLHEHGYDVCREDIEAAVWEYFGHDEPPEAPTEQ